MFKSISLCVIVVLLGAPAALANWETCVQVKNLIWNEKANNAGHNNIGTRDFRRPVNVVRHRGGGESEFSVLKTDGNPLPKITFDGKAYELWSFYIYSLDTTKYWAAVQLTFALPDDPEGLVTYVTPILADPEACLSSTRVQSDLLNFVNLGSDDSYQTHFSWFPARLLDVIEIDKVPVPSTVQGKKEIVFLTDCLNMPMSPLQSIIARASNHIWKNQNTGSAASLIKKLPVMSKLWPCFGGED